MLRRQSRLSLPAGEPLGSPPPHWIELAAEEKAVLALEPTNRIVPTTRTRITANITAYSAMSWPSSPRHMFQNILNMFHLLPAKCASRTVSNCEEAGGQQNESIMSEVAGLHLRYAAIVRPGHQLVKQKPCPTRLLAHPTSLEHPSTNHAKSVTQVASDEHRRLESLGQDRSSVRGDHHGKNSKL